MYEGFNFLLTGRYGTVQSTSDLQISPNRYIDIFKLGKRSTVWRVFVMKLEGSAESNQDPCLSSSWYFIISETGQQISFKIIMKSILKNVLLRKLWFRTSTVNSNFQNFNWNKLLIYIKTYLIPYRDPYYRWSLLPNIKLFNQN